VAYALLLEKVDAMTLAAMQAGDDTVTVQAARDRFQDALLEPFNGGLSGWEQQQHRALGIG
jgi:hypothetical protein